MVEAFEHGKRVLTIDEVEKLILERLRDYGPLTTRALERAICEAPLGIPKASPFAVGTALRSLQEDGLLKKQGSSSLRLPDQVWNRESWFWYRVLLLKVRNGKDFIVGSWHLLW